MYAVFKPSEACGSITAPPSKSMAHRLLICAGLADGESVIRNLAFSDDVSATIACLRSLGADIRLDGNTAYVKGVDVHKKLGAPATLPCNECGSTLRFFIPICLLSGEKRILSGTEYLMNRPLSVYETIASEQEITFVRDKTSLTVSGILQSGVYEVAGDISSQFISGLLFALPLLDGDSELRLLPPVESKPYIDMTLSALSHFGIEIDQCGNSYRVKGGQKYRPCDTFVEGDYSNAAFFEALNVAGGRVNVDGLREDSAQGDKIYTNYIENIRGKNLPMGLSDCPDLGPVMFSVAAMLGGARFVGTKRLRIKESDRIAAMQEELAKLGVMLTADEDSVTVNPGVLRMPDVPLDGHGDHRIVMALSVLLTVTGGVIEGAEHVNKSFPDFFEKLQELGIEVQLCNGSATPEY